MHSSDNRICLGRILSFPQPLPVWKSVSSCKCQWINSNRSRTEWERERVWMCSSKVQDQSYHLMFIWNIFQLNAPINNFSPKTPKILSHVCDIQSGVRTAPATIPNEMPYFNRFFALSRYIRAKVLLITRTRYYSNLTAQNLTLFLILWHSFSLLLSPSISAPFFCRRLDVLSCAFTFGCTFGTQPTIFVVCLLQCVPVEVFHPHRR